MRQSVQFTEEARVFITTRVEEILEYYKSALNILCMK